MIKQTTFVVALLTGAAAHAQVSGVNYTTGDRNTLATINYDLPRMAASGVTIIRFPLEQYLGTYYYSERLAELAWSYGIRTHWVITATDLSMYQPETTARQGDPNNPAIGPAWPLSALNPVAVARIVDAAIATVAAAGVPVEAIELELGNEINNPAFNGDFAIGPKGYRGTVYGLADLQSAATTETATIAQGFRRYVLTAAAVKAVIGDIPLTSTGLYVPPGWYAGNSTGLAESAVALGDALTYLRNQELGAVVDYYGTHSYPWGNQTQISTLESLALGQCAALDHPCQVTEWGYHNSLGSAEQLQEAQQWQVYVRGLGAAVSETLWFDWSGPAFGVWQNGTLTPTGSVVVQ